MARALLEIHATCTVWHPSHRALCAVNNTRWLAVVGQSLSEALTTPADALSIAGARRSGASIDSALHHGVAMEAACQNFRQTCEGLKFKFLQSTRQQYSSLR